MTALFSWKDRLAPVQNTSQQLKGHLLSLLLIRVCLFTLIIGITMLFQAYGHGVITPPWPVNAAFLLLIALFSVGSVLLIRRPGMSLRRFGVIQLLADTLFTALLVYANGCSQSIFTPVFIVPIIAGGLILYRIGGLIPAASATLLYGTVLALELFGLVPPYFRDTPYQPLANFLAGSNLLAGYGITFFVIALVSGQLAGRLRHTEQELSKTTLEFDRLSLLYKQIFDDISTGIITTNQENYITSYNNAAQRITGYDKEEVLGRPCEQRFPELELESSHERNVCDFCKRDGSIIRVGYSLSHLHMPTKEPPPALSSWRVITLQDISTIEQMEQQVREAEKMAAIGELSASIAHDFRNPLAAISGSAQILAMEQDEASVADPTSRSLVGIILRESDRMAKTITDFLQFARPAEIKGEWFDLRRLVNEVIAAQPGPFNDETYCRPPKVEIEANLHCWADRQQLQTVLSHLLENSRTSAGASGHGETAIRAGEISRGRLSYNTIEICDQGPGIPPELRERVFTPFFSTREDGTGLGLAIVKQIIENHQGRVEIDQDREYSCILRLLLPNPGITPQESV
ncbi:ATP-binding protein [Desulfogranum mediterraneum]|uniref:ATP-binding protein n=1 Tax=Desulfogranum mediterraneum TaxID=160661 RepID=UPI0003F796FE|nr:ATP-binding protein [Desulfogranum mediterraneum]